MGRRVVVDLMLSLIGQGQQDAVAWYLGPAPDDHPAEVTFRVESSDGKQAIDPHWVGSAELGTTLQTAARRASEGEAGAVEVWSANGQGLRRRVLVGEATGALRSVPVDLRHYAGSDALAPLAENAWNQVQQTRQAPDRAGEQVIDAAALSSALQEALGTVQIEVDFGSVEGLVGGAIKDALAELPAGPVLPQGREIRTGVAGTAEADPQRVSPELMQQVSDVVHQAVESAVSENLANLRDLVSRAVASAGSGSSSGDLVMADLVERSVMTAMTGAVDRLAPDPIDAARRIAASILSPAEIAESLLFRLRPALADRAHAEAALNNLSTHMHEQLAGIDKSMRLTAQSLERLVRDLSRNEGSGRTPEVG